MPKQKPEAPEIPSSPTQWLRASYLPVSLFSLRMTHATNKGGKTLVLPTPYAVKMALLDASFRHWDGAEAEINARHLFDWIKSRQVRICPPKECIVQNTFVKILDYARDPISGPYRNTIAYREFAYHSGEMEIALEIDDLSGEYTATAQKLFACVNMFGKRGSFWQFNGARVFKGQLPGNFTLLRLQVDQSNLALYQMSQAFDDFGEQLCKAKDGFDRISTYGRGSVILDQHRILELTAIPYRRVSASRRFTWYRRTD